MVAWKGVEPNILYFSKELFLIPSQTFFLHCSPKYWGEQGCLLWDYKCFLIWPKWTPCIANFGHTVVDIRKLTRLIESFWSMIRNNRDSLQNRLEICKDRIKRAFCSDEYFQYFCNNNLILFALLESTLKCIKNFKMFINETKVGSKGFFPHNFMKCNFL